MRALSARAQVMTVRICGFLLTQVLTVRICDSAMTGRPDVGYVKLPLVRMPNDGLMTAWLPVQARPSLLCNAMPSVFSVLLF